MCRSAIEVMVSFSQSINLVKPGFNAKSFRRNT